MPDPWPWPADDALTRARRVGHEYRDRLERIAPDVCAEVDDIVVRLGQAWITGVEVSDDPVLTTAEAAVYLTMTPRGVRMAVQRGGLVSAGQDSDGYLFFRSDLIGFLATRRGPRVADRNCSSVPS